VPVGYVVIFQDVTHVVAMERELRRSERLAAVGEMAARIAHEIRNPLASISGSIEILRKDLEGLAGRPDSEPASLMAIVMRETERLNGLITDFLHYARPGPVRRERIALGPLLGDVRRMLEAARPEGVEIRVSLEDAAGVRGDPAQLRQLLWNLCLNGVQAMSEGGVLGVRAERVQPESSQGVADSRRNEALHGEGTPAEAQVEIAVSDSGAGIPLEVQERMFEPFFTTKRDGTGLGLATVHRIVEGHGGELRVESEPGRGTCFRVRLPAGEGPG
jgi:two-component system sensor histidine kinase PilS (NtrC family)